MMRPTDRYQALSRLRGPRNQPAKSLSHAHTPSPSISSYRVLRGRASGPAPPAVPRAAYLERAHNRLPSPAAKPGNAAPHGWPGSNAAKDIALPAYGEPGHPVAEDFETSQDETKTLFFERKVSIFQVWQLFLMWMALTGLVVYIASLIGFREVLIKHIYTTATSTPRYTDIVSTWPGNVSSRCNDFTPCRGEAQCVGGRCICEAPDFIVVEDICVAANV